MKFHLQPDQFPAFRKRLVLNVVQRMTFVALLLGLFLFYTHYSRNIPPSALLLASGLFIGANVYSILRLLQVQKKAWDTYELCFFAGRIERSQAGYPSISLPKNEIVEAIEATDGSLTLVAKTRTNSILIPPGIEAKPELVALLAAFTTIKQPKRQNYTWLAYLSSILGIVLMVVFMASSNFLVILGTGTVLIASMLWAFIEIQRNKNVDLKFKRLSYIFFITIFSLLIRIIATY